MDYYWMSPDNHSNYSKAITRPKQFCFIKKARANFLHEKLLDAKDTTFQESARHWQTYKHIFRAFRPYCIIIIIQNFLGQIRNRPMLISGDIERRGAHFFFCLSIFVCVGQFSGEGTFSRNLLASWKIRLVVWLALLIFVNSCFPCSS